MTDNDKSSRMPAVEQLEVVVRTFVNETCETLKPSECGSLLLGLNSVQTMLTEVYDALARSHANAAQGKRSTDDDERDDPQDPSGLRAALALQEATQYSRDAAAAIDRARTADEITQWFDEVRVDEGV